MEGLVFGVSSIIRVWIVGWQIGVCGDLDFIISVSCIYGSLQFGIGIGLGGVVVGIYCISFDVMDGVIIGIWVCFIGGFDVVNGYLISCKEVLFI